MVGVLFCSALFTFLATFPRASFPVYYSLAASELKRNSLLQRRQLIIHHRNSSMGSLLDFRPPQFSEDDAWLPPWLHQCGIERLNVECISNDLPTFEKRVEELLFLRKRVGTAESCREEGGCNISQLVLSETFFSPTSFVQSSENMVQFHLRLFSDVNSENTAAHGFQTESISNFPLKPLEHSEIPLCQEDSNLSLYHSSNIKNWSQTLDLQIPTLSSGLLKCEDNENSFESADDAVELSIAASEALVINEVIKSDVSAKLSPISAILEASLQVKQARLEVWKYPLSGSLEELIEIDDLSDLDDTTMETAYEDTGVYFINPSTNELSVSQVKDTMDSECDDHLKVDKTKESATNYHKSSDGGTIHTLDDHIDREIQLEKDLSVECVGYNTQKNVVDDPGTDLSSDGDHNYCLSPIQFQTTGFTFSEEKVNSPKLVKSSYVPIVGSSPTTTSYRDAGKDDLLPTTYQERFHSRWFGGWKLSTQHNEKKYAPTVNRRVPEPFACQTSFFSESTDLAPDVNSFVQNCDRGALTNSQISLPSQNFPKSSNNGILPAQDDVRSSNTSFLGPLCSVVPCSISENASSSSTINYDGEISRGCLNTNNAYTKVNLLETSTSNNELAQRENIDMPINDTSNSPQVCRKVSSLRIYSKLLPANAKLLEMDSHQERLYLLDRNDQLASCGAPVTNCEEMVKGVEDHPVFQEENSSGYPIGDNGRTCSKFRSSTSIHENPASIAIPESNVKTTCIENPQWALSKCKRRNTREVSASKKVRFSEDQENISENKKLQKVETPSCFAKSVARSSRTRPRLNSGVQHLNRFLKSPLGVENKRRILHNMEFMLTGFSCQKEKELEGLIRKYGGIVLSHVPSINLKGKRSSRLKTQVLPIVLCFKKIQSLKFLYGCAVNAFVLKADWLTDSIAAGYALPPKKYMVLSRSIGRAHAQVYIAMVYDNNTLVFKNVGFILHGETKSFPNIANIIKHGGGQVFKTLQRLVQSIEAGRISTGVVVANDETSASRHLKHCASEQNITMTSVYWVIRSLYAGHLVSLKEKNNTTQSIEIQRCEDSQQLSQEI